jgi:hypothetical protein
MADTHEQEGATATPQAEPSDSTAQAGPGGPTAQAEPSESTTQAAPSGPTAQAEPSEEEMRAAYEAELNRITSSEMILQTAVSLLNIGGRRLGLAPPAAAGGPPTAAQSERDLEQVRDAIDAVSALLPILERRMPRDLGPLRDAIAQLRFAYAREAQAGSAAAPAATPATAPVPNTPQQNEPVDPESQPQEGAGPAQASGRLWVPGR